jgi:hypothetical protein
MKTFTEFNLNEKKLKIINHAIVHRSALQAESTRSPVYKRYRMNLIQKNTRLSEGFQASSYHFLYFPPCG